MTARDIVGGLAGAALSAAKHPVGTAKKVVGTGFAATEAVAHTAADHLRQKQGGTQKTRHDSSTAPGRATDAPSEAPSDTEPAAAKATPEKVSDAPVAEEPQVVLREPGPPEEPPVNIVEQVLAEEQATQEGFGRTTEPRGSTRDEEHGDAALQRAEAEEIAEESEDR